MSDNPPMFRRMQNVKISKDDSSDSDGSAGSSHSPMTDKNSKFKTSGPVDNMSSKSSDKFSSDSLTTEIEDKEEYTREELGKTTIYGGLN